MTRRPDAITFQHGHDWAKCTRCIQTEYCGCCGTDERVSGFFCRRCEGHVLKHGPPHMRTWFAQFASESARIRSEVRDG